VLRGHYAYYGLPSNWYRLDTFYAEVRRIWYRVLNSRSQRGLSWSRFYDLLERFPLPTPRIMYPRPVVTC
jgi:RNA-directed DNA polymerase